MGIVAEETDEVGEFRDVLIGEVFLEHGLVALLGGKCGPEVLGRRIGEAELRFAVEPGPRDAGGEGAEPLIGVGEIGETSLPEQGVASVEKVKEVHKV